MHYIMGNPLLYNYDFWRYIWNYIITNPASLLRGLLGGAKIARGDVGDENVLKCSNLSI
jgi:hypothetical protein